MQHKNSVIVVGGGASGLIAAIAAVREGADVVILEKMDRVGKKILATGNGRCNFTNIDSKINRFHGSNPKFALGALKGFDVNQTIQFFEELGISHKVETDGKIFPFSDQASSVLDVLRMEIAKLGIKVICQSEVKEINKEKDKLEVKCINNKRYKADKVILATGGKASSNFGSNGSGFVIVKNIGHTIIPIFPALVHVITNSWFCKRLKGVKFKGNASLYTDKLIRKEYGEVLFTEDGLSGPPIFQLSRKVGECITNNKNCYITLDMFPDYSYEELLVNLQMKVAYRPKKTIEEFLIGFINKRLIPVILKEAGIEVISSLCCEMSEKQLKQIVSILKDWKIHVEGTRSFKSAQVTAGGVNTSEVNSMTMESKIMKGLYIVGEVLDIDGDCGGFNLQWAWSSGYIAGFNAANS